MKLESLDDIHFQMQNSSVHIIVKCKSREERDKWLNEIGIHQQEQAKARTQRLAVKRSNQSSIRNSTHTKILDSFQQLHDRNTMSRKDAEAIRAQMAAQEELSRVDNDMANMSLKDHMPADHTHAPHLSAQTFSPPSQASSTSTLPQSSPPNADSSPSPVYRTRVVQTRSLRSARIGASIVDKINADLTAKAGENEQ